MIEVATKIIIENKNAVANVQLHFQDHAKTININAQPNIKTIQCIDAVAITEPTDQSIALQQTNARVSTLESKNSASAIRQYWIDNYGSYPFNF